MREAECDKWNIWALVSNNRIIYSPPLTLFPPPPPTPRWYIYRLPKKLLIKCMQFSVVCPDSLTLEKCSGNAGLSLTV